MSIERTKIETPDGVMPTVIARPDDGRSRMNVLLFMDAMGIREELEDFAHRFARAGYTCLLPDLYYRWGEHVSFDATKSYKDLPADEQDLFYTLVERMRDDQRVLGDVTALLGHMNAHAEGSPRWAAVGYCMGGRFTVRTLAAYPELFLAGVSAYGTALVTDKPDSPHRDIPRITGEVYLAFGADDELTPPATIETVGHELEDHEVRHEIETFPGCGHAFMMPGKASSYRPAAAEEVWRKGFALLERVEQRENLLPAEA